MMIIIMMLIVIRHDDDDDTMKWERMLSTTRDENDGEREILNWETAPHSKKHDGDEAYEEIL